jgi:hypothetical protein
MNQETLNKAIAAVQKQIDAIINEYVTTGPRPDHEPLIQAFSARDLLRRERSQLGPAST